MLALYDLAISPLTFDFAYAAVQSEAERRRRGCEDLVFYIRLPTTKADGTYARGEADWRVRHIIVPLTEMLPKPATFEISSAPCHQLDVFSRPGGLHWLSDLAVLADRGVEVQLLRARGDVKADLNARLAVLAQGRRIVTITLRETYYGSIRNSDLRSWAALARCLPNDRYLVIVLRDYETVSENLVEDWGDAISWPAAVWSMHERMAMYELAWLNLAVNNGPLGLLVLNRTTRFQIFKLDAGSWETSPQHFRRLGIEPGQNFPFLGAAQQIVWCDDGFANLQQHVFALLEALDDDRDPVIAPSGNPVECLVDAARRDYRSGVSAADTIGRIAAGHRRSEVALEWVDMLLDEGRYLEAANALLEAPHGEKAIAKAHTIAAAFPDARVTLAGLLPNQNQNRPPAAGGKRDGATSVGDRTADLKAQPVVVSFSDDATFESAMTRIGIAERERRRRGATTIELRLSERSRHLFPIASLFAAATLVKTSANQPTATTPFPHGASEAWARGMALVPPRAMQLLTRWVRANELGRGYVVTAIAPPDDALELYAANVARSENLAILDFFERQSQWPLEMIAALLKGAKRHIVNDLTVRRLAEILDIEDVVEAPSTEDENLLFAENAFWQSQAEACPSRSLIKASRAVRLMPDCPTYRRNFAVRMSRFDPSQMAGPGAMRLLRRKGIIDSLMIVVDASGRAAATLQSFVSRLILCNKTMRFALERAATASGDRLDAALSARPLHAGTNAALLRTLMVNVAIQVPELLTLFEAIRERITTEVLTRDAYEPSRRAGRFIESLGRQAWIQDGIFISPPDYHLKEELSRSRDPNAALSLARSLYNIPSNQCASR